MNGPFLKESEVHIPGNLQEIDGLYAVLSVDEEGREGICASTPGPCVFGYEKTARAVYKTFTETVSSLSQAKGYRFRLVKFEKKTILEGI